MFGFREKYLSMIEVGEGAKIFDFEDKLAFALDEVGLGLTSTS